MTAWTRRTALTACGLTILAGVACGRAPEGWTPVLEETSTTFLKTDTEAVAEHVRAAKALLPPEAEEAAAELAEAQVGLDHLLDYYLPLLEARERAYNAYRHFHLGESDQTLQELEAVESILTAVGASGDGRLLHEVEEPLEQIEDARAALGVDAELASKAIQELATRLNFLLVKGGLVLAG